MSPWRSSRPEARPASRCTTRSPAAARISGAERRGGTAGRLDRAGDAAFEDVRTELDEHLHTWMRDTGDPLIDGPVPVPAGGLVNDPAGRSPTERPSAPERHEVD